MKTNDQQDTSTSWWRWALARGALAGLLAGLLSALWNVLAALAAGATAWLPVKAAAFPFLGEAALLPGFAAAPVVLGVAVHLFLAAIWGGLFALGVEIAPRKLFIPLGAFMGVFAWGAVFQGLLPLVGARRLIEAVSPREVLFAHVLFGMGLGFSYLLLDSRSPEERLRPEERHGHVVGMGSGR